LKFSVDSQKINLKKKQAQREEELMM
jgi:hypothetical protein